MYKGPELGLQWKRGPESEGRVPEAICNMHACSQIWKVRGTDDILW